MMKRFRRVLNMGLVLLALMVPQANGADRQAVDELYVKSGLARQMESIGPALWTGYRDFFRSSGTHSDREKKVYQHVERLLAETFDTRLMKQTVTDGLMRDIPAQDMERILAWLDSPAGRRITALEEQAATAEGMRGALDYIKNIKKKSVPASRRRLVDQLDEAMDITATTIDVTLAMQFALSMTMEGAGGNLSRDRIAKRFQAFRKERKSQMSMTTQQVRGTLLYTYRDLTDEEFGRYLDFLHSKSGKRYSRVTSKYLLKALGDASLEFAYRVSNL